MWRDGGATSADNEIGVWEAHNDAHEAPGHRTYGLDHPPDDTGWGQPPAIVHRFPDGSENPSDRA